jgi:hypothetical protein
VENGATRMDNNVFLKPNTSQMGLWMNNYGMWGGCGKLVETHTTEADMSQYLFFPYHKAKK